MHELYKKQIKKKEDKLASHIRNYNDRIKIQVDMIFD